MEQEEETIRCLALPLVGEQLLVRGLLAARFEALPVDDVRERYFRRDGIHPTRAGDAKIAELLQQCFDREPELRTALAEPAA